jgi:Transposase DNA-binding
VQEHDFEKELEQNVQTLSECDWIKEEFIKSDFEDKRLFLRLLAVTKDLASCPTAPINQASGSWKYAKSAYRFFDNDKITSAAILKSHSRKTQQRIADHVGVVLAIQDTTFLNYSHMKCSEDLGPIGKNKNASTMGLVMHTVFAVTAKGLPLGFLHQDIWARDKKTAGTSDATKHLKSIAEKESNKWLKALKEQVNLLGNNAEVVAVCDREADIYQLFELANQLKVKVLVRAMHNRCLENGEKLWDSFVHQERCFTYVFQLPDTKNDAATLAVKYAPVSFALSANKRNRNNSSKTVKDLTAIYLEETDPPLHREAISWMLIINCRITSTKKALEVIGWYVQRWKIEILHRIMKSGCSVELTRLETNKRRLPFITLKSIIAWRLLLITHYNKILPNAPATSILTQNECAALSIVKNNKSYYLAR